MKRAVVITVIAVVAVMMFAAYPLFVGGPTSSEPGGAARVLLRGDYPALTIEVDTEVDVPDDALDKVADFVRRYSDKWVVSVKESLIDAGSDGAVYVTSALFELERKHRDTADFSFMSNSIYVIVLDGRYQAVGTAGVSYGATSIAVFYREIPDDSLFAPIIAHEIGHLWGLSCLGYEPPQGDDWKCDGTGHSTDRDSLMAARIDTSSIYVINLELKDDEQEQLAHLKG